MLEGYIEIAAESEEDALAQAEDGFSLSDFTCESSEVDNAELVDEVAPEQGVTDKENG